MVASIVVAPFDPRCQPIPTLSIECLVLYINEKVDMECDSGPRISPAGGNRRPAACGRLAGPRPAAGCPDGPPGTSHGAAECRARAVPRAGQIGRAHV